MASKIAVAIFSVNIAVVAATQLVLRDNGGFVLSQITDLHYGEAESLPWGPAQDANSTRVMRMVLPRVTPDLAMFTGDAITGNNVHANATAYLYELTSVTRKLGLPHAYLLGNHDCMPFQQGHSAPYTPQTSVGRRELMQFDAGLLHSVSTVGPSNVTGASNYLLEIGFDKTRAVWSGTTGRPALLVAVLDTGGGDAPETVTASQLAWLQSELEAIAQRHKTNESGPIPMLAYFHIPTAEYVLSRSASSRSGTPSKCFGFVDDDIAPVQPGSADLVGLLTSSEKKWNISTVAASVGHNHGRDDCCLWEGTWLCFGRHSGYGGYGSWARGLRNIRVSYPAVSRDSEASVPFPRVETWVSMEDGTDRDDGVLAPGTGSVLL